MSLLTRAAIARLPKADLHLHLEGAVSIADLHCLYATPRSASLWRSHPLTRRRPRRPAVPRRRWPALYRFSGFAGFLRSFGALCDLLAEPEDFGRLALRLAARLGRQGVRRAEVFVSLPVHLRRGLRGEEILESILSRREAARRQGLDLALILDGVRQWGSEALAPCLALAQRYRDQGVVGIGLGGDEGARGPEEFQALFRAAREAGLHTVLHSGEVGGPPEIERGLRTLEPERLGHALRAAEDPALLDELAERRIPVEVAVTSNWRTGLIRRRADHPLPRFLRHGVRVVLAADDPAFFRTTLVGEYALAQRLFGLSAGRLRALARDSLRASFAPPGRSPRPLPSTRPALVRSAHARLPAPCTPSA